MIFSIQFSRFIQIIIIIRSSVANDYISEHIKIPHSYSTNILETNHLLDNDWRIFMESSLLFVESYLVI